MKSETISNFIWVLFFSVLGLSALCGAIFFSAWWHLGTGAMCLVLARALYVDDEYGTESVRDYFKRRKSEKLSK